MSKKNRFFMSNTSDVPETNERIQDERIESVVEGTKDLPESIVTDQLIVTEQAKSEPEPVEDELFQTVRNMKTKSEQIRYLDSIGMKRGPIAKLLSKVHGKTVLYQHVRNVLIQPLKKS